MPKICYVEKVFTAEHEEIIAHAESIILKYMEDGYQLTLRQLYYQFVARDLIPNTLQEYKRIGGIANDARLAGRLDWDAIEDRTRNLAELAHWDSPKEVLETAATQFRYDRWAGQDHRIEVWVEKEALISVVERAANKWRVPFMACRGYMSQSEVWAAARRFNDYNADRQSVIVIHLGDHDPSGIDMTRDNETRLRLFSDDNIDLELVRIALNEDQVRRYNPPPNPAKITDSRADGYIKKFGNQSWELDALEPAVIGNLIEKQIRTHIDWQAWEEAVIREEAARVRINEMAAAWDDDKDDDEDEDDEE